MAVRNTVILGAVDDVVIRFLANRLYEKPWRRVHLLRPVAHALHVRAPTGKIDIALQKEAHALSKGNPFVHLCLMLMSVSGEFERLRKETLGQNSAGPLTHNGHLRLFESLGRWRGRDVPSIMQDTIGVLQYLSGGRYSAARCPPAFRSRCAAHVADLHVRVTTRTLAPFITAAAR